MSKSPLVKVISGFQIGADQAGLRAAHNCGLATGGWVPRGRRTKRGPIEPFLMERFNLVETYDDRYPLRTRVNVENSDGTIQLAYDWETAGERLTSKFVREFRKPNYGVDLVLFQDSHYVVAGDEWAVGEVVKWIRDNKIATLNVAGNGDSNIEFIVESFLNRVFRQLQE